MKTTLRNIGGVTLLAWTLLSLTAINAPCQTVVRRSGAQSFYYLNPAASLYASNALFLPPALAPMYNGQTLQTYRSYAAYQSIFPNQYNTTGTVSSLNAVGNTNLSNTVTGVQSPGAGAPPPPQNAPQASGALTAQRLSTGDLLLQWHGDLSLVQQVEFALFDANGQMLTHQIVTQLPVQARLTPTTTASHYGVQVTYSDGTNYTTYVPIR